MAKVKKVVTDRGRGTNIYKLKLLELNINFINRNVHIVVLVIDPKTLEQVNVVHLVDGIKFEEFCSAIIDGAPEELVWDFMVNNEQTMEQLTLGRKRNPNEDFPIIEDA